MARLSGNSEKGGSRLKTLAALAIVFVMIFFAIKIVPIFIANYELQNSIQDEATYASVTRKDPAAIRADIQKKLKELGLPDDPNAIQVSSDEGNVSISLEYTVPVNLSVYQLDLHFHPTANNSSL